MTMSDKKPMKEWTTKEVTDWVENNRATFSIATDSIISTCNTLGFNGSILVCCDLKSVIETFSLDAMTGKMVYRAIKQEKNSITMGKAKFSTGTSNSNVPFTLNIMAKSTRLTLVDKVIRSTTVREVQRMYYEQEIAKLSDAEMKRKLKSVQLISSGVALDPNRILSAYGITDDTNLVTVLFTALGGTTASAAELDEFRDRKVNLKKFPQLKRTTDLPDCISMEYEDETALMPCGHAISPDMMYMYIKHRFHEDINAVVINCPVPECDTEWDWKLVTAVADMTTEEYLTWTENRDRRLKATRDEKDCPHCAATCKRKAGVVIFRMRCSQCSNSDWCWECAKPWNHSGLYICGNSACKVITDLNSDLSNCTTIEQAVKDGRHDILSSAKFLAPCPSIRACPRCLTLMFHKDACKHMKCVNCLKYFCFFCLALKQDNGSYGGPGCVGAYSECKNGLKPKQIIR